MSPAPFLITVAAALVAVVTTRVQLLPDVIDFTVVLTAAGFGGLTASGLGAGLRFGPDRLGRLTLSVSSSAPWEGCCSWLWASSPGNLMPVRYAPFIAVSVLGLAVGLAGVLSLGVGAAYGGLALAIVAAVAGYAERERRAGPHTH